MSCQATSQATLHRFCPKPHLCQIKTATFRYFDWKFWFWLVGVIEMAEEHTCLKATLLHLDIFYFYIYFIFYIPASRKPLCSTLISGNRMKYNERRRGSVGRNHFLIPFLPRCLPLVPPKSFHQSRLDPNPTNISWGEIQLTRPLSSRCPALCVS